MSAARGTPDDKIKSIARRDGGSSASPARRDRRADAEVWLGDDFEIVDEGPPVGSVAVGAFGVGFDLVEPGAGVTGSFDASGTPVPASLIAPIAPESGYEQFVKAVEGYAPVAAEVVIPASGSAPERLEEVPGAFAPAKVELTVEEQAEGQEEALESTALPGRVEVDGNELAERLAKDPTDFGIVHDRSLDGGRYFEPGSVEAAFAHKPGEGRRGLL